MNKDHSSFNPKSGLELLRLAAREGNPEAMWRLAREYERGIYVAQDLERARELFLQSAELDYVDAHNDVGILYWNGDIGFPVDRQKAVGHMKRAADLRHPKALFNYAKEHGSVRTTLK